MEKCWQFLTESFKNLLRMPERQELFAGLGNRPPRISYSETLRGLGLRKLPDLEAKLDLSERSWCWRATRAYQDLPISMRNEPKLGSFKSKLRTWVKENIDI